MDINRVDWITCFKNGKFSVEDEKRVRKPISMPVANNIIRPSNWTETSI